MTDLMTAAPPSPEMDDREDRAESSPDNPQTETADQQQAEEGLTDDEKTALVELISSYRKQWSTDRLLRFPQWLKNTLFYKGIQVLGWDPSSSTYFDALSWYRQNGSAAADDTYLEKYINNITQMFGTGFVAALSRGVPPTLVRPENAENLADTTTARAAQEAIGIIERANDIREMVRHEDLLLYLYGCYFKHTRLVIDGEWAGWEDGAEIFQRTVTTSDRYHCSKCGTDTPAGDGSEKCFACGTPFGPADFYPGEAVEAQGVRPLRKAKAMVKWSVHGPMQIDADPKAQKVADSPVFAFETEVDVGWLRMTFPEEMEAITEGAESTTNANASYERLVRNLVFSKAGTYTTDIYNQQPTYTLAWVQPQAYYRAKNQAFIEKMTRLYPQGCRVAMVGPHVLRVKPAVLEKEWTACLLHPGVGLYPPSIADNVVPFNERFNDAANLIDDHMERDAVGMVVADGRRLDLRQLNGKRILPGVITDVPTKGEAGDQPMTDLLHQFEFALDPKIFEYLPTMMQFCQSISGITPEVFGIGTHPGVETAKGQAQMLDQATSKLSIYWENLKVEHAAASQNAIECLQHNKELVGDLWSVIEERGSEFRNNYVRMQDLEGRIRVYPDIDQGLPRTPEQVRDFWQQMFTQAEKNPAAQAVLDIPSNQEQAITVLGVEGMVIPGGAQRSKTLQDIKKLLEPQPPIPNIQPGPNGQPVASGLLLPVQPSPVFTDFKVAKETVELFAQENCDLEQTNPEGWKRLNAYYGLLEQLEMQKAAKIAARTAQVRQAGAPQQDPAQQQAAQVLLQDGARAVEDLQRMSEVDPLMTKGTMSAQVSAASQIVKSAIDVAKQ